MATLVSKVIDIGCFSLCLPSQRGLSNRGQRRVLYNLALLHEHAGRRADELLEGAVEVTLAGEAGRIGSVSNRGAAGQQALGVADADAFEVFVRRNADLPLKQPRQMVGAEADLLRQMVKRERLVVVRFQVGTGALDGALL